MAKARSPSYPAIGLKEAIEKVSAVYKKDYQNPIARAVAATHMGYQSLNGKSLGVLSAVAKYGLMDGRGDDFRVTDLGVMIIAHPPGSKERIVAIKDAGGRPELFAELDAKYSGGRVSDQTIRSYLMTQKFLPVAADAVIRAYRETKQLVEGESGAHSGPANAEVTPMQPAVDVPVSAPAGAPLTEANGGGPAYVEAPPPGVRRVVFDLAEGDVVIQVPDELSAESVEDLEGYLEVFINKARRNAGLPKKAGATN